MGYNPQASPWALARNISNASMRLSDYAAVNTNRQARFDARCARRWGDWGILEVPTAVLWFDEITLAADAEIAAAENGAPNPWEPAIIDIWS